MNHHSTDTSRPDPDRTEGQGGTAARLTGAGRVELVQVTVPDPGPREVRVRLEGCGVCGSNLGPWAGPDWMVFPTEAGAPGHEGWGRIESVGARVTEVEPGQRVALLGNHSFATHEVLDVEDVVVLPPALDDIPFPGEAFACAMNIFRRSNIGPGTRVAIIGIGFIGGALTRLAASVSAEVVAIGRRDASLTLAREMGAAWAVRSGTPNEVAGVIAELSGRPDCDVVIEAVGTQDALDIGSELVAPGGRLVIAGYHQDGPRQVNMQQWNWRGIDVINAHERSMEVQRQGLRDAIDATRTGRLDPSALVTHCYPLDQLGAALDMTRDKADGFVKAYVRCT